MKTKRKLIAMLLVLCTCVSLIGGNTMPVKAASYVKDYIGDNYCITYEIVNMWDSGQQIQVLIRNTGMESIVNWGLQADSNGMISDIWNAMLESNEEGLVKIRNNQYNSEIQPGESVQFGYILKNITKEYPDKMLLTQQKREVSADYEVEYCITNDWRSGFQGNLVITNAKSEAIEGWELVFNSNSTLSNLWGAEYEMADDRITLKAFSYANRIEPGQSVMIGFTGVKEEEKVVEFTNYVLTEVITYPGENSGGEEVPTQEVPTEETPTEEIPTEIDYTTDTDKDGLCDYLERELGCEVDNPDTDGDGLLDGYEVFKLATNPLLMDSNENGLSDDLEDFDADGLSNMEEYLAGTDPFLEDSDGDGLNDFVELKIYQTNPNDSDTDDDGIEDYDEVMLGLNPNGCAEDGVKESEIYFCQNVEMYEKCFSTINENCEAYQISVEVTGTGYAPSNLSVSQSQYSEAVKNSAMVGMCVQVDYDDAFSFEKMKLQFHISDSEIENRLGTYKDYTNEFDGVLRYQIFKYDEDATMLVPIETQIDIEEKIVFTEVKEEGNYCIIDLEKWLYNLGFDFSEDEEMNEKEESSPILMCRASLYNSFEGELLEKSFSDIYYSSQKKNRVMPMSALADSDLKSKAAAVSNPTYKYSDVVFVIQGHGYNGNQQVFENELDAIRTYAKEAYVMVPKLRIRVLFTRSNSAELDSGWLKDIEDLNAVLDKLTFDSSVRDNGDMSRCLNQAVRMSYRYDTLPFVIWVMSGNVDYSTKYRYNSPEDLVYETKVASGVIGEVPEFRQDNNLAMMYIDVNKVSDPEAITMIRSTSEPLGLDAVEHLYQRMEDIINGSQFILTNNSLERLPEDFGKVSVFYKSRRDYDGDGLLDNQEIDFKTGAITYKDREMLYLPRLDEQIKVITGVSLEDTFKLRFESMTGDKIVSFLSQFKVLKTTSNPLKVDSDGDGVEDKRDASPYQEMDKRFNMIESIKDECYYDLMSDSYLEAIGDGEREYATMDGKQTFEAVSVYLVDVMGSILAQSEIAGLLTLVKAFRIDVDVKTLGNCANASNNMLHFLSNTGTTYFLQRFPESIAVTRQQRYAYYCQFNCFMDMVEKTVVQNQSYQFATSRNSGFNVSHHDGGVSRDIRELDWWLTVGGAQNAIVAEVNSSINDGKTVYVAVVDYYLMDYYDWSEKEKILKEMHTYGMAHNFVYYGKYQTVITWEKGARFPNYPDCNNIDINQLWFDGVQDKYLNEYYNKGMQAYLDIPLG